MVFCPVLEAKLWRKFTQIIALEGHASAMEETLSRALEPDVYM